MMRLLITGGSSYLGQYLVPLARAEGYEVWYTYHQNPLMLPGRGTALDVRDETAVHHLFHTVRPQVVIHTAGSNRVGDMEAVIEEGARHVTAAARAVAARLIHLSTDSIFNGRADDPHPPPYDESAPPSPVNAYGRAKANAEALVRRHPNHLIVRTSLIYGLRRMDHGVAWMARDLRAGKPVTLFDNQRRNPVWVGTLSRACLETAVLDLTGVLNVAGAQTLTRAAFSLKMLDWWRVQPRRTLSVGAAQGEQWPLDCELDVAKASALLQTPLLGVDEILSEPSLYL
jgi:dTDP-4-dehydrorhamnose reductase